MTYCNSDHLITAMRICAEGHKKQVDKAGNAYALHSLRVAAAGSDLDQVVLGLIHDIVEDTSWTLQYIRENGFPEEIIVALDAITHRKGESAEGYLRRVAQNDIAIMVKFNDIDDNSNLKRLALLDEDTAMYLRRKYSKAAGLLGQYILERRRQEEQNELR